MAFCKERGKTVNSNARKMIMPIWKKTTLVQSHQTCIMENILM